MKKSKIERTPYGLIFTLVFFTGILLTSCASLVNKKTTPVNFSTNDDSAQICIIGTQKCYTLPATIYLPRSNSDVYLRYNNDSVNFPIVLKSKLSNPFLFGNLFSFGIPGYFFDMTNPRRFEYPKKINIINNNSSYELDYKNFIIPKEKTLNIKISIPFINIFSFNDGLEESLLGGFYGVSFGAEYYLLDQICISSDIGIMFDMPSPLPSGIDYSMQTEHVFAQYGMIQAGMDLDFIHLDIGLQINQIHYRRQDFNQEEYKYKQANLGFAFSTYLKMSDDLSFNLKYLPSFYSFSKSTYRITKAGLISFGITYNINP